MQNTVSKVLKTWYFPCSAFWLAGELGDYRALLSPSDYMLLFLIRPIQKNVVYNKFFDLINAIQINTIKCSFVFSALKIAFIKLSPT